MAWIFSELVVLQSSEQKLYMLLVSNEYDGPETILNLIGCHKIEDVKMVLVGLGLQIVRVHFEKNGTYQFITRSLEKSRQLFCILDILDHTIRDGLILRRSSIKSALTKLSKLLLLLLQLKWVM
ncbi:hypothetical protein POM88_018474 [Heracleum sosnowskyi]|uniref:Uncharacterized protein n=1 Tax=Heracleum sosnowskyi TaxID=360622 RepID=A0AAD8IT09_9APIA|nr:hypothetical protein POM88_018474 [Heracleum sosnowskyi]